MSCDICGRGACTPAFHSSAEQDRYEKVIELFDKARELRAKVRAQIDEDENDEENEN